MEGATLFTANDTAMAAYRSVLNALEQFRARIRMDIVAADKQGDLLLDFVVECMDEAVSFVRDGIVRTQESDNNPDHELD